MRTTLSKRVRFEVLKRDDFKCQYCGAEPPGAALEVDHIHPVAKGGENNIGNLITACSVCNAGKADGLLLDNSSDADKARRRQLYEEFKTLLTDPAGIASSEDEQVESCAVFFEIRVNSQFQIKENRRDEFRQLIVKHSAVDVIQAINLARRWCLRRGANGRYTQESAEYMFREIPAICVMNEQCGGRL